MQTNVDTRKEVHISRDFIFDSEKIAITLFMSLLSMMETNLT